MITLLTILATLLLAYLCTGLYALTRNLLAARASGLPYILIPWDQNSFLWMALSVPLRPFLQRILPAPIFRRVALTIYGFEFHERTQLFGRQQQQDLSSSSTSSSMAKPLLSSQPHEPRAYVLVSPGQFELNTMDAEVIEQVLRRHHDFVPHTLTGLFMARFGPNVLTSDGEAWVRQRRVVAGVINERISKTVFAESVRQTEGLLAEVLGGGMESGETSRLFDMMKKITINVLSGAGMGASVEWEDRERPKEGYRLTYIEGVKRVINAVSGPIIFPKWLLRYWPGFMPGVEMMRGLSEAIEEFPAHTMDLLERERERSVAAGGEARGNIMSQLLQASDGEKGGKALSEEEMMGNLFIFTAAGFDTTANTLSYALVVLARYPAWQEWICEEIDAIMPDDPAAELEYTAVFPKATRVMAVMLETLRLYTPLVHISKMTRTAQTIQTSTTTYHIPANSTVYLNAMCLHIDPAVWRNVNLAAGEQASDTDELTFRPSRWINAASESMPLFQPPKGAYVPWSAGPRVCPGMKMAQVEFTSIFLTLFRRHRIEAMPLPSDDGMLETRQQVEKRLDQRLDDSISILTLQMNGIYNVAETDGHGLKVRLQRR